MPSGAGRRVLAGVVLGLALAAPTVAALLRRGVLVRPGGGVGGDPLAPFLDAPCERVHVEEQALTEPT